jgi:hypothetical protein
MHLILLFNTKIKMRFILLFDFAEQNQTQNKKAKLNAKSKSHLSRIG